MDEDELNNKYPFARYIIAGDELKAVTELDLFIETQGLEIFKSLRFQIILHIGNISLKSSLLWYAAFNNYLEFARKLISLQVDVDDGIHSLTPRYNNQSPLMAACENSDIDMIKLLLGSGANLLHRSDTGLSILWKVRNTAVCRFIIEEAKNRHCHLELLAIHNSNGHTAFEFAHADKNMPVYSTLLAYEIHELQISFIQSEIQALAGLQRFITLCPVEFLHTRIFQFHDRTKTPLYFAAKNNYLNVAKRLIDLEVPVDEGVSIDDPLLTLNLASPLLVACYYGHLDMCHLLLDAQANIFHVTDSGISALMLASSVETFRLLLEVSRSKGGLYELLAMKSKENKDVGSYQCKLLNSGSVVELMDVPDFHHSVDIKELLMAARLASAVSPEQSGDFDEICNRLQVYQKKKPSLQPDFKSTQSGSFSSYYSLFRQFPDSSFDRSFEQVKTEAIKSVISQYYHLLLSPDDCMNYLRFLNDELQRYYQNKYHESFPVLDLNKFDFRLIGDLMYPIPASGYTGIKKHKALSELLFAIFKEHGLAEQAVKWIGFIPNEKANEHVIKGSFFTEGTYGVGLLHGKLAHMLQRVLLIYAIEDGTINLTFQFNNKSHLLTVNDIFEGLVSIDDYNQKKLWLSVQDQRPRELKLFTAPHRLTTTIMSEGHASGLPALATSLIDSFGKGFNEYLKAYRENTPFSEINLERFIGHLSDLTLDLFSINPALIKAEKDVMIQKRGLQASEIDQADDYALVPKIYEPDPSFHPCDYQSIGNAC